MVGRTLPEEFESGSLSSTQRWECVGKRGLAVLEKRGLAVLEKSGWSHCLKKNGGTSVEIGMVRSGRAKSVVLDTRLE